MGMEAQVLAIGGYQKSLKDFYDYPAAFYEKTPEGAEIVTYLGDVISGSIMSRKFAHFLGISDPWDFAQHKLDPGKIDFPGLHAFAETLAHRDEFLKDIEKLRALHNAGYRFYFLPNG